MHINNSTSNKEIATRTLCRLCRWYRFQYW